MKSIATGIGSYGLAVVSKLSNSDLLETVIAMDSDINVLNSLAIENKIYISKRLSSFDAVERIKNKLKKTIAGVDIVFIVSNPIDLPSPYVLPYIVDFIKSLGITVVALVIDPNGKYERQKKNEAKHVVEILINRTATIKIPQKNINLYSKPNYQWYEYYLSQYMGRDKILEQVEFDKWYLQSPFQGSTCTKDVLIGVFYIQRTLELLNCEYPYASKEEILSILNIEGVIHIASAVSVRSTTQTEQIEMLRIRAFFNEMTQTSTHGSTGLLFVLTVSERISKAAVGQICYMMHTFSLENTRSAFTINVVKNDSKDISVKLLATGADDMDKDNH